MVLFHLSLKSKVRMSHFIRHHEICCYGSEVSCDFDIKQTIPEEVTISEYYSVEMNAYLDYRKDDQTPLIAAVKHEQQNMVKYLLSKKADIFTVDGHHNTILHLAAKMGDRGICKLALENGTLPHVLNEEEKTPIELSKTEDVARTILSNSSLFFFHGEILNF